jgi:hypothetical protein
MRSDIGPEHRADVREDANEDRRKFLATCGKFAVVTPPAITLLLSTSLHSPAIAASYGKGKDRDHDYYHRDDRDDDRDRHKNHGWWW